MAAPDTATTAAHKRTHHQMAVVHGGAACENRE